MKIINISVFFYLFILFSNDSYEKQYKSAEEIHKRFGIFMDNFHRIRSTNKKGLRFTVGINGEAYS